MSEVLCVSHLQPPFPVCLNKGYAGCFQFILCSWGRLGVWLYVGVTTDRVVSDVHLFVCDGCGHSLHHASLELIHVVCDTFR